MAICMSGSAAATPRGGRGAAPPINTDTNPVVVAPAARSSTFSLRQLPPRRLLRPQQASQAHTSISMRPQPPDGGERQLLRRASTRARGRRGPLKWSGHSTRRFTPRRAVDGPLLAAQPAVQVLSNTGVGSKSVRSGGGPLNRRSSQSKWATIHCFSPRPRAKAPRRRRRRRERWPWTNHPGRGCSGRRGQDASGGVARRPMLRARAACGGAAAAFRVPGHCPGAVAAAVRSRPT